MTSYADKLYTVILDVEYCLLELQQTTMEFHS